MGKVTCFYDTSSGGFKKSNWRLIFVEAPEEIAIAYFKARFERDPFNVTDTDGGIDYSVTESDSLEEATGYHRSSAVYLAGNNPLYYDITLEQFLKKDDVLLIPTEDLVGFDTTPKTKTELLIQQLELGNLDLSRAQAKLVIAALEAVDV